MTITTETRPPRLCPLNPTELNILRHLSDGHTRAASVRAAGLRPESGGKTLRRMFIKTSARSSTHLVAMALRKGWIR